jgi:hypothetical protein
VSPKPSKQVRTVIPIVSTSTRRRGYDRTIATRVEIRDGERLLVLTVAVPRLIRPRLLAQELVHVPRLKELETHPNTRIRQAATALLRFFESSDYTYALEGTGWKEGWLEQLRSDLRAFGPDHLLKRWVNAPRVEP